MNSRERVRRTLDRQPVDRIPMYDSYWWDTERDFRQQGIPQGQSLVDYFQLDMDMFWFEQSFLLPEVILEETAEKRLYKDSWGTTNLEFLTKQTSPGLLGFAVGSRDQWEQEFRPRLDYHSSRIDWPSLEARYQQIREANRYAVLSMLDPFECGWRVVGPEEQLKLMIKDPAWLQDIYQACTKLIEDAWQDLASRQIQPDALWLYGDIAYKNGPLFSPRHYQELLKPFHARLVELAHSAGAHLIYHTDGDMTRNLPDLIEIGVDCLHPLEVKAGVDVLELKKEYGNQITLMGNIDARLFESNDRAGLEQEIRSKIPRAMAGGGYIYHSDHSIPPGTTLDTYRFALDLVREVGNYNT